MWGCENSVAMTLCVGHTHLGGPFTRGWALVLEWTLYLLCLYSAKFNSLTMCEHSVNGLCMKTWTVEPTLLVAALHTMGEAPTPRWGRGLPPHVGQGLTLCLFGHPDKSSRCSMKIRAVKNTVPWGPSPWLEGVWPCRNIPDFLHVTLQNFVTVP